MLVRPESGKPALCPRCDPPRPLIDDRWNEDPDITGLKADARYSSLEEANKVNPKWGEVVTKYVDLIQNTRKSQSMLLHGTSGMGKTTLAAAIAKELKDRQMAHPSQMLMRKEHTLIKVSEQTPWRYPRPEEIVWTAPKFMVIDDFGYAVAPPPLDLGYCRQHLLDWIEDNAIAVVFVTDLSWSDLRETLGLNTTRTRFNRLVPAEHRIWVDDLGPLNPAMARENS